MRKLPCNLTILLLLCVMYSACEKDNYASPQAAVSGALIDAETNGPLELTQDGSNSSIRFLVKDTLKYPSPAPYDISTFADGTFKNTMMFAETYTVYPYATSGPWMVLPGDTLEATLTNGTETQLNFQVIPYFRVEASVVDSTVTFTVTKSNANQSAHLSNLTTSNNLLVLINNTPVVNESTSSNTAGVYVNQFRYTVTEADLGVPIHKVIPYSVTHLDPGTYYVRVAVVGDGQNGKFNYSASVETTIP